MKSYDGGDTWTEVKIWECPYSPPYGQADTFYCPDGSHDLAIDNNGLVHVVFSLTKTFSDAGELGNYFADIDGVVYWNENMPAFSSNHNALNPEGHPDSELVEDVNLIGWSPDIDGNGTVDLISTGGAYNTGLSSQPQIAVDDNNQVFVVYSSATEGFVVGDENLRHLWARTSPNGGEWWGELIHLNENLIYIFDECVFPSLSSSSDDYIHLIYQADGVPGTVTYSDYENYIRYMKLAKADLISGVNNPKMLDAASVSQNYPNPFSETSTVYVNLKEKAELSLEVSNLVGQVVYAVPATSYAAGNNKLTIEAGNLNSGVYFYTVRSGNTAITKKMIIE
jgi:hypothetical protein